ncbi:phage tail protein [Duganella sp. CT11-25]|uniref:phage tail protein n=1 Tax=unclassified Duganella TaxID=2636909 RepID=UPI0039AEC838
MSVALPNGITWALAVAYASALTVTAASNAAECVLTVTNTLAAGDIVEFTSGWSRANARLFRVKSPAGGTVVLEGFDTTSTVRFPAASGTGTIRKVNTWTSIQQIMDATSSGGDPQYATYSFQEDDYDRQIPTTTSAQSLAINIADDPTLAGYQAVKAAAESRLTTGLRASMPQGGFIYYNGIFAFDETPSMSKGNVMQVKAGCALQGKPVRYAS